MLDFESGHGGSNPPAPSTLNMKTYIVEYTFYNRDHLIEKEWVAGNCYCPSTYGMWSFRLYPKTNTFKFLVSDGPVLSVNDTTELLWGHKAFGHIIVKAVVDEID